MCLFFTSQDQCIAINSLIEIYYTNRSSLQRDCKALLDNGCTISGIYSVKPDAQDPIEVYYYCIVHPNKRDVELSIP